jgi:uncharacterized membrane protein
MPGIHARSNPAIVAKTKQIHLLGDIFMKNNTPEPSVGTRVERNVTINKPPDVLYRFWRNFENLPLIMNHLESVRVVDDKRSHWVAKGPAGTNIEWDSELTKEIENEQLDWQSLRGSQVTNLGSVLFKQAPDNRGTEVKVIFGYDPPGGSIGAAFAKLFGEEPSQQVADDLRRFKQLMETGEIATVKGQPSGS